MAVSMSVLLLFGVGATAYTSFTADRTATMDVVSDDLGILVLEPDPDATFVTQQNGEVTVDVTLGGASGVNVDSTLKLGDSSTPTSTFAFNVTNNDNTAHDLTFDYVLNSDDSDDTKANVKYKIYNSTGSLLKTVTEESGSVTLSSVSSGTTLYVVVEVDTTGLTTSDNLSGTLKITSK